MRIDGMSADLVPIGGLAVGADGTIAISQLLDHRVRFFSVTGDSTGSFGRSGEGPGEFDRITRIGWLADTLWVMDFALGRITLVTPGHRVGRSIPVSNLGISDDTPIGRLAPLALYPDRTLLALAFYPDSATFIRKSLENGTQATLAVLQRTAASRIITVPTGTTTADVLPTPPVYAVAPHGAFVAVSRLEYDRSQSTVRPGMSAFALTLLRVDGDTAFNRLVEVVGEPIARNTVDSLIAAKAARLPFELAVAFRRGAYVPPYWPPVVGMVVTDEGDVWVQMRDTHQRATIISLNRRGHITGSLNLPANTVLAAASERVLWCLEKDANDVESIVRYRVK
jgi:hypothetical protein